jgi:SNF2 family DNA or RNA helicase
MGDTTESIPSEEAPVKAIVFSQWTGMLDLMGLSLNSNNIQFRRLDGAMCLNLREKGVNEFQTDPEVLAFYPFSSSTVCLYLTHIFR